MAFEEKIRKLREEQQMTQQQLADRLYVSRQTVCRWENGTRCPDLIMAKKLAMELGVSLDELISEEDVESKNAFFSSGIYGKMSERKRLLEYQKKIAQICEILGLFYTLVIVLCRVQFQMRIPGWAVIPGLIVVVIAWSIWFLISKKLDFLH